ncbi:MAG: twin-arginine translocase TatA/TatE family subunit, partial [Sphingomonadales bacterium]
MLDFNAPEFLVVAIVALLVIGPKDLPKAMRFLGK